MKKDITTDPDVALSGLLAVSLVAILFLGIGFASEGLVSGSWLTAAGGVVIWAVLSWLVWQGGRVVRQALRVTAHETRR